MNVGNTLPRDLEIGGYTYTLLWRSHSKGGKVVMLSRTSGHRFMVFGVVVENGCERLGQELGSPQTFDQAIQIASQ